MYNEKILGIIEKYRVLTSMGSLPFIIDIDGESLIGWFYYDVNQIEDRIEITIDKIYFLKAEKLFMVGNVNITVKETLEEYKEPIVSEDEYLDFLDDNAHQLKKVEVFQMLSKAVIEPMLKAYKASETYCAGKRLEDASNVTI